MADLPIPFSPPMVLALLKGRKTQTRRALNPQPYPLEGRPGFWNASGAVGGHICISDRDLLDLHHKPKPGDRLYVREAYYQRGHWEPVTGQKTKGGRQKWAFTPADNAVCFDEPDGQSIRLGRHHKDPHTIAWHKRLGRFMPRWASRLTLIVTDVRVERLQDINLRDALAEGCAIRQIDLFGAEGEQRDLIGRAYYGWIWEEINGAGSWNLNPWVAAISFSVIKGNIDQIGGEA